MLQEFSPIMFFSESNLLEVYAVVQYTVHVLHFFSSIHFHHDVGTHHVEIEVNS